MKRYRALLLVWFSGIVAFFAIIAPLFIRMMFSEEHRQVIVYEPNKYVFWGEAGLLILIIFISVWILYNYVAGKGVLEMNKRN